MRRGAWPLLLLLVGCEWLSCQGGAALGCGGGDYLAVLTSSEGEVRRDFAASVGDWRAAEQRARFHMGDGLRTGAGASAMLELAPGGAVRVESDTIVRFQQAPPGQAAARMDVAIGGIEVEAGAGGLALETLIGTLQIERNGKVRLRADDDGTRMNVLVGALTVERGDERVRAQAGEELVLDVGGIVVERPGEPAKPEPEAQAAAVLEQVDAGTGAAPDAGEAALAEGDAQAPERDPDAALPVGPKRADVTIAAGEAVTIHDPRPPTHVRVPFAGCARGGVLEVARGKRFNYARVRGEDAGIVRLPPGRYRYRTRCLGGGGGDAVEGRVRIQRDAGTRRLPSRAPSVTVDADGRRYTVRYQNRLPAIVLRWPEAPQSAGYAVDVESERGGKRSHKLTQARHALRSGALGEGLHRFTFRTADGKHSAAGSLRIDFDNAATTAYVSEPSDGGWTTGQATRVAGAALRRSSVRVGATAAPLDTQGRFDVQITPDGAIDAIPVRVEHPGTGVHVYLRRMQGVRRR